MKKSIILKTWLKILVGIFLIAISARLAIPKYIAFKINQKLGDAGHVGNFSLSLWRLSYQLNDLEFRNKTNPKLAAAFSAASLEIGIHRRALLRGKVVATVNFIDPEVNIYINALANKGPLHVDPDWTGPIMAVIPIQIDRLQVKNGVLNFRDPSHTPELDIWVKKLNLTADGLSNQGRPGEAFTSAVTITAMVMNSGKFEGYSRINPFAKEPTFENSSKITGLEFADLNPFLMGYLGFKVSAGSMNLSSESSAALGKYKGYVCPVVMGLKIMDPHEKLGLGKYLKKETASLVGWIFKKPKKTQDAIKLKYEGTFSDPNLNLWQATISLYEAAFLMALPKNQ